MLARHFSRYFDANPGRLHFAAHSHHPWPDATRDAHLRYWDDAATLADRKWTRIFDEVVPRAQAHVARLLQLADPRQVAFAPNTHEFVVRLLSCLPAERPAKVVTSAHEFHSFRRQARRLQEAGRIALTEVPAEPWGTFTERFIAAVRREKPDLAWLSHVFFDSGFVVPDLDAVADAAPAGAIVAIDGYHAFCALPVDLSRIHRRAFYIAGGYKYAMSGEGACFLAIPPGCDLRPVNTGWYAAFGALSGAQEARVPYGEGAMRFWGSTFDPSGIYRFNAAMEWLQSVQWTIADVHHHALTMQKHFVDGLARLDRRELPARALVPPAEVARGNFLAFDIDDAESVHRKIESREITIDRRDRRLRFGFGVYHDVVQVGQLLERLASGLS